MDETGHAVGPAERERAAAAWSPVLARCAEGLDAAGAVLVLAERPGGPPLVAGSPPAARELAAYEAEQEEGPGVACLAAGEPVVATDLRRWPAYAWRARRASAGAVLAVPVGDAGYVAVLYPRGPVPRAHVLVVQALAGAAALVAAAVRLSTGLQAALDSRVVIEQAKGIVAERHGIDVGAAFDRLRAHARDHNLTLTRAAADVVAGTLRL